MKNKKKFQYPAGVCGARLNPVDSGRWRHVVNKLCNMAISSPLSSAQWESYFRIYSINRGIIKAKLSDLDRTFPPYSVGCQKVPWPSPSRSGRELSTPTSYGGSSDQANLVFLNYSYCHFSSHDTDNNKLLDGWEMLAALSHLANHHDDEHDHSDTGDFIGRSPWHVKSWFIYKNNYFEKDIFRRVPVLPEVVKG